MYSRLDDILALAGFVLLVAGVYLWLGLAAALILTGGTLIFVGWRIETRGKNEHEQVSNIVHENS